MGFLTEEGTVLDQKALKTYSLNTIFFKFGIFKHKVEINFVVLFILIHNWAIFMKPETNTFLFQ